MTGSERIPLFPLGVVLFPDILLPLHIFKNLYLPVFSIKSRNDIDIT